MSNSSNRLGGDFGTSNSCFCTNIGDSLSPIPSWLLLSNKSLKHGANAKRSAAKPDCCPISYVKTIIGRDFSRADVYDSMRASYDLHFNAGEKYPLLHFPRGLGENEDIIMSPQYAVSLLLWKNITEHLSSKGKTKDGLKTVLTIPARYTASQIHAYREAAELVCKKEGLIGFIPEPSAAILGYSRNEKIKFKHIVVFDMGGGTFDVTVVEKNDNNELIVKSTGGHHAIGGVRFDFLLLDLLADEYSEKYDTNPQFRGKFDNIIINSDKFQELMEKEGLGIEALKIELSSHPETGLELSEFIDDFKESQEQELTIGRDKFEEKIKNLINKSIHTVKKCLEDAGVELTSEDAILLVGGSSQIPCIETLLRDAFPPGVNIQKPDNVNTVVAEGAYRYAYKLNPPQKGDKIIGLHGTDISVVQFAPYSVYYSFGIEKECIIKKNTSFLSILDFTVNVPKNNPIMSLYQEMIDERTGRTYYLHFGQIDLSEFRGQRKEMRVEMDNFGELEFRLDEGKKRSLHIRYDCVMSEDEKKKAEWVIKLLDMHNKVNDLSMEFENECSSDDEGEKCDEFHSRLNQIEQKICSLIGKNRMYGELEPEFSEIEKDLENVKKDIMSLLN